MNRSHFVRSLLGFALVAPAGRLLAAELHAGDGSASPRPVTPFGTGAGDVLARLRARREIQIRRVVAYARRGLFPRNVDFRGERVPYFVDDRGYACAVAHLMIQDGLRAEVDRIAAADNHVRVMDVSEGPLVEWVLGSGLLQEEAARVQPGYDFMRPTPPPIDLEPGIVERRRIQRHLETVVAELRRDAEASLATAVDRFERSHVRG